MKTNATLYRKEAPNRFGFQSCHTKQSFYPTHQDLLCKVLNHVLRFRSCSIQESCSNPRFQYVWFSRVASLFVCQLLDRSEQVVSSSLIPKVHHGTRPCPCLVNAHLRLFLFSSQFQILFFPTCLRSRFDENY